MKDNRTTIVATVPCTEPPTWALLERRLIDAMDEAVYPFLAKYTNEDDELIWREGGTGSRDGADDFYEATYNWPLVYLLGCGKHLLDYGQRIWDGITRQLTRAGMVDKEYELGYDQFHQGESYIAFYFLCLADPTNPINIKRARRFAGFYLNEDADAPNYDSDHKLIRAAHNGSGGPRWGFSNDPEPSYNWGANMRVYGLPFHDLPGIDHYDDLQDPAKARRMGQAMHERMGQGDVAGNLIVTSLAANAYLLTGEDKYRDWIVEYVDAWRTRAENNGGLLPDNVGLSGEVGEYVNGKWYGGLYGWTWPHGYYNIGMAAAVAGANAFLVTGRQRYLDLPRSQYDIIWDKGELRDPRTEEMSLRHHWVDQLGGEGEKIADEIFVVPYRYRDKVDGEKAGWFDYQPMSPVYPVAVWNQSMAEADWARIEQLRAAEQYDWRTVKAFRNKEDGGHDQSWLRFLAGDNPDYPEQILRASYANVCRRLALIEQDEADLQQVYIHHWQQLNPVVTEALIQLTLGGPQIIYNGGLLHCRLRYFDLGDGGAGAERPGLPQDVAALVSGLEADRTVVHLVNLSPIYTRRLRIQAGGFGEHRFVKAEYETLASEYPGSQTDYAVPAIKTERATLPINNKHVTVILPPTTEITLDLTMDRYVNQPRY